MEILKWFTANIYKNIVIVILIIIAVFLTYKIIRLQPEDHSRYDYKLDSITRINTKINLQVDSLKYLTGNLNLKQKQYRQIADSLSNLLKVSDLPCEKVVTIQSDEISALRAGLKQCNQAKAIQVTTIQKYSEMVINHELIAIEHANLQKVSKKAIRKAKFRSFIAGVGVGAIVVGVLVLL